MICPECKETQYCPCDCCKDRNKGKVVWIWDDSGEIISCGHCGHAMHADGWLDEEAKQVKEKT